MNSTHFYYNDNGILKYTGIVILVKSFPINFFRKSHTFILVLGSLKTGILYLISTFYATGKF